MVTKTRSRQPRRKRLDEYEARGLAAERTLQVRRELGRLGLWLKSRRPRPRVEEIDAELIVGYVRERTTCRAKAAVSGVMSTLRGVGHWLVREGYWQTNPLKWLRGPKLGSFRSRDLLLGCRRYAVAGVAVSR